MKMILATACLVLSTWLAHAAGSGDWTVTTVDFPGAANTALYALNAKGHYVGAEKDGAGRHHAIWSDGRTLALLDPDGPVGQAAESWAYSINRHDEVAGVFVDAAGATHGFVRRADGAIEVIDVPGAAATQAYGINGRGSLIGLRTDGDGSLHAVVRRSGTWSTIDLPGAAETVPLSINDREDIVGEVLTNAETLGHGYLQRPGGRYWLVDAPGAAPDQTFFISINNRRDVLGSYIDADGVWHNFVRREGRYLPFELPAELGSTFTSAQTINDSGDIVGYYVDAGGTPRGFIAVAREAGRRAGQSLPP